jgi:hypothetical protein
VLLRDARPPSAPGWLMLSSLGDDGALYVADSDDLAADTESLRRALLPQHSPLQELLEVRWVEARTVLSDDAGNVRARRAIEVVLLAHLKPEWPGSLTPAQGVRFNPLQARPELPEVGGLGTRETG